MGKNSGNYIISITGPSASGKSMLAKKLSAVLGRNRCAVLCQDDYYKDWSYLPRDKRKKINFDDVRAFDFQLLARHVRHLKKGKNIEAPRYCFKQSKRLTKRYTLVARRYVIIEGLMPILTSGLRSLIDYSIYVDIDSATGLSRRLKRDIAKRAETIDSVCKRYFSEVIPMQKRYVEPQKKWADLVVNGKDCSDKKIINKIRKLCLKHTKIQ